MWIIARLLFSFLIALARVVWGRRVNVETHHGAGASAWVERRSRNKRRIVATWFGVPCANRVFLQLSPERGSDRFFKFLGFSRELQTGDAAFDAEIYVTCDHPALAPLLESDSALRDAIRALFRFGVVCIQTDGRHLWAKYPGDQLPDDRDLAALRSLRDSLSLVSDDEWRALRDPFVWRALVAESVAWSLAIYGLSGIAEHLARPLPLYFHYGALLAAGVGVGIVYLFLFLLGLRTWIGRSSRGHRIFLECVFLLVPGLLWLGVENLSQVNIHADRSAPLELRPVVTERYTQTHRRRRGRTSTSYHLRLDIFDEPRMRSRLPFSLSVPASLYNQAEVGRPVSIRLRQGALGFEWVESITAPQ